MKVTLKKDPDLHKSRNTVVPWTACEPFLENTRAVLIHRPKHVTTHKIGPRWTAHLGVHLWCGNATTGREKLTFLAAPPKGRIVCARCEAAAVKAGLPASSDLVGAHVHLGGVIAIAHCCTGVTSEDHP